ncbi:MAG TPA: sigma-70 family RNA polymerase sigma factor [Phycisphaeraceae bacterium]
MDQEANKPLSQLSDEMLVERYRAGNERAFEVLMRRYRQELFHFLLRFVGNRAAAEDLFQETFLQVHLSIDTFDPSRSLKPWLFTIAANKARDYLRRSSRQQAAPLSALIDQAQPDGRSFIDLLEADLPLPTEDLEKREIQELVQEVVSTLPDHLREVLLLAYFNRFAYKEIAAMLNIPLGTVKSRLHAAVGTFAQLWKSRYEARHPSKSKR